jgi:hypothetical protein
MPGIGQRLQQSSKVILCHKLVTRKRTPDCGFEERLPGETVSYKSI